MRVIDLHFEVDLRVKELADRARLDGKVYISPLLVSGKQGSHCRGIGHEGGFVDGDKYASLLAAHCLPTTSRDHVLLLVEQTLGGMSD